MYARVVVGYAVGFGLGLLLTGFFFESVLSPLGNPITVAETRLDWSSIVTTWKFLGLAWLAGGVFLFYVIRAREKRGSGSDTQPSKGDVGKGGSSEVDDPYESVHDVGDFGAIEKNLDYYRKQLEELERGLIEAGLDVSRLKARIRNRDFSEPKKE